MMILVLSAVLAAVMLAPTEGPGPDRVPATREIQVGPLVLRAPSAWELRKPSSRMRLAEIVVPAENDNAEALVIVAYHFPRRGGTVDANVERWFGQFSPPEGKSAADVQKREEVRKNDIFVTLVETVGTYNDRGPTMGGQAVARPDYMLLGAIVPSEKGPYFFKFVGPKSALTARREDFRKAMTSVRFGSAERGHPAKSAPN